MKKLISLLLVAVMSLSLIACGGDDNEASVQRKEAEENVTAVVEETNEVAENIADDLIEDTPVIEEQPVEDTDFESIVIQSGLWDMLQQDVATVKEQFTDMYSDIDVQIVGKSICYLYVYDESVDTSMITIDKQALKGACKDLKDQIESLIGVRPEAVSFIYYNADGSLFDEYTE
ncbi:MAG: hypothetical protein MJ133_00555 [Lachnospiraceae bacterium]|nr:hypothetical protein [Lachnospiraceae bacterium]